MGAGCGRLDDTTEEGRRIAHHLKSLNADFVPVQPDPSYCRLKELCLELPIDRFCAALGLREVEVCAALRAFKRIDTDRSGELDLEELARAMGVDQKSEKLLMLRLFRALDANRSGLINFREFLIAVGHFSSVTGHGSKDWKLRFCFQALDGDNNGWLTAAEIRQFLVDYMWCTKSQDEVRRRTIMFKKCVRTIEESGVCNSSRMSEEDFVTLVRDNSRLFKPLEDLHSRLESFFNRMLRVNRALLTLPEPSELEAYFSVEDGAVKRWNGPSIDSNDTIGVEGGTLPRREGHSEGQNTTLRCESDSQSALLDTETQTRDWDWDASERILTEGRQRMARAMDEEVGSPRYGQDWVGAAKDVEETCDYRTLVHGSEARDGWIGTGACELKASIEPFGQTSMPMVPSLEQQVLRSDEFTQVRQSFSTGAPPDVNRPHKNQDTHVETDNVEWVGAGTLRSNNSTYTQNVRGICPICSHPVTNQQKRDKDEDGRYYHRACVKTQTEKKSRRKRHSV